MAYGDEKIVADVREGERGQILYVNEVGKEHTYYPARYSYFDVQDLQTWVVLTEAPDRQLEPVIVRRIRGTARLEDRCLSVIGDPKSATRTLSMSFEASDWRPKHEALPDADSDLTIAFGSFLGGAMLSFNPSDWEIGNEDEWWAACYLPNSFMEQLEAAVMGGHMSSLRVGLALRGLYSDEGDWAPVSARCNLFIRPNRKDNDVGHPDLASGFVSSIAFTTTKVDLREPPKTEPDEAPDDLVEPASLAASADPISAAIVSLAARVEATRGTIKWVGGLIVMALLLVAGR